VGREEKCCERIWCRVCARVIIVRRREMGNKMRQARDRWCGGGTGETRGSALEVIRDARAGDMPHHLHHHRELELELELDHSLSPLPL
jgi:hypothetical protein